ncbi:hypothetical protein QVD17_06746 [Tagetes erecta]|uniref:Uncharacterized protein n=1 Tax=Tagetes erecta TaxID=13708 RepID=A0AAD8PCE1_TARER|nr:hypothetical protein QVD17_06746 [Tagetes erecta]
MKGPKLSFENKNPALVELSSYKRSSNQYTNADLQHQQKKNHQKKKDSTMLLLLLYESVHGYGKIGGRVEFQISPLAIYRFTRCLPFKSLITTYLGLCLWFNLPSVNSLNRISSVCNSLSQLISNSYMS